MVSVWAVSASQKVLPEVVARGKPRTSVSTASPVKSSGGNPLGVTTPPCPAGVLNQVCASVAMRPDLFLSVSMLVGPGGV